MSAYIVNAAPMVKQLGTEDLSKTVLPREPEAIPQHCPKFFLYAQKGPVGTHLVGGVEATNLFGAATFDLRSKYANHATVFAQRAIAEGNACMLERIVPSDAGPEATVVLWLDVLPTTIDVYERNTDGSIKLDAQGAPTISGTTAGFKVKWVKSFYADKTAAQAFGQLAIAVGTQVDPVTSAQSQRYPILEAKLSYQGDMGNLSGLCLWAPTVDSNGGLLTEMMASERAYPLNVAVVRRPSATASPAIVKTLFGEQFTTVTLKPGVIDPSTDKQLYIGDTLLDTYQNLNDARYPLLHGDFGTLAIYEDNIELLAEQFHAAEAPHIDMWSDFTVDPADKFLFNFVGGVSSQNVPYHSFQFVDNADAIRLTEYTNVMAAGGSDGTMSNELFAQEVAIRLNQYLDPSNPVQELAVNVESHFYDSGFPLATKKAAAAFIAVRKDTFAALSTYTVGGPKLSASEEHSLAIALRTHLQMYPESEYFGTPVSRAIIIGRSGRLRNSQFKQHLPLTLELLIKSAKYMGASNGKWKNGEGFDAAPGSVVQHMHDISITWVPEDVRNRNWDVGLNWVQSFDRHSFFFPALKTVYNDDTSVLNSYFTACAIGQLNKIAHRAWRQYSGVDHLTNAQLAERCDNFVNEAVKDKFDNRFVIVPKTTFTDMDVLRGFSWTLPIEIWSANMKTVMTTYVQARRLDDLTT